MAHFLKLAAVCWLSVTCWLSTSALALATPFTAGLPFDMRKGEPGLPNTKLEFAYGSSRYVALVRRAGRVVGAGCRGAMVQEWGLHEVTLGSETNGRGTGYLVITRGPGHMVYLNTQLRRISVSTKTGEQRAVFNDLWEVSGTTGIFKGLQVPARTELRTR